MHATIYNRLVSVLFSITSAGRRPLVGRSSHEPPRWQHYRLSSVLVIIIITIII